MNWPCTCVLALFLLLGGCAPEPPPTELPMAEQTPTAAELLGNPDYPAMSYGGYRTTSRDNQPTIAQLKEDLRLLHAMGIRLLRTYNVHLAQAGNLLAAIRELRAEEPGFEMYVMLGAWIDAKNAWTGQPVDHERESPRNAAEIARAIALTNAFPEVVKIIAVGNESMVKWATNYFVQPRVILRYVNLLQGLKREGQLPADLWITSSDNFASWGGGDPIYHVEALEELIRAVDFLSVHTYPMHDTHYNPAFWGTLPEEAGLDKREQIRRTMERARDYAAAQYQSVVDYVAGLGVDKPIHIGETGWASRSNGFYGAAGSLATDEYKQGLYHDLIRDWSREQGVSCFYFEGFDEPWKDAGNPGGSENFFGLFTVDGQAKYALWPLVKAGTFEGLGRNGQPVGMTYDGQLDALLDSVLVPPVLSVTAN